MKKKILVITNEDAKQIKEYFDGIKLSFKKFSVLISYSQCHTTQVLSGVKHPSFKLAKKIDTATGGKVPISIWYKQ